MVANGAHWRIGRPGSAGLPERVVETPEASESPIWGWVCVGQDATGFQSVANKQPFATFEPHGPTLSAVESQHGVVGPGLRGIATDIRRIASRRDR
jgi:hypothetical protein